MSESAPAWFAEMVMPVWLVETSTSISPGREPDPLDVDPRPCGLCGLTIDRHQRVDTPEGPEFFCFPDDAIVTLWELADPRDSWRHTGELPPPACIRNSDISAKPNSTRPYRTPQATIDAFMFVARLDDQEYFARWLVDHKREAPHLLKIWKAKQW
jgi:hypothetical protein